MPNNPELLKLKGRYHRHIFFETAYGSLCSLFGVPTACVLAACTIFAGINEFKTTTKNLPPPNKQKKNLGGYEFLLAL